MTKIYRKRKFNKQRRITQMEIDKQNEVERMELKE
jgi:hypothetical protein